MRFTRILLVLSLAPLACGKDPADSGDTTAPSSAGSADETAAAPTASTSTGDDGTVGDGETTAPTTGPAGSDDSTSDTSGTNGTSDDGGESGMVADCPAQLLAPGDHTVTLMHDGLMRTAIVHVPEGLDPTTPVPLVLNFHGFSSNASQQVFFSAMNPLADTEGFVVVYPEGLVSSWNAGVCCGEAIVTNRDDVGFVRALVAELHTQLCLDARRVYATGMSNGGFMAHRLACEASDLVAAVAPVSAANGMASCEPGRAVPVLMFNGTLDTLVPYVGNGLFPSVAKTFSEWAARNGCGGDVQPGETVGLASSEHYDACEDGVRVIQWTMQGMGHCWPGQAVCPFGAPNLDVSANEAMWAFFQAFTLP